MQASLSDRVLQQLLQNSRPFLLLSLNLTFILCLHGKVQLQQLTLKPFPQEQYFKETADYYNMKNKRWTDG